MDKWIMKKLTIAIPTYNREKNVRSKIEEISTHIIENGLDDFICLMIVDNYSNDYDLEQLKSEYKSINFIQFHKNLSNIGAGANFLRCVELANSEYVWLLGDDENLELKNLDSHSLLKKLLESLKDCDCYLLPHNESYAERAAYFGKFRSVDDLLDNYFHFGSFFVLSIYIFKKDSAIKYMKMAYEAILYQHPYSAIALQMLESKNDIELIKISILRIQSPKTARFDIVNAHIDAAYTVKPYLDQKQFWKYLKKDFLLREKEIFSFNIGISNPVSLNNLTYNYKRTMAIAPLKSKLFLKSLIWLGLVELRKNSYITAFIIYMYSHVIKTMFSEMSYNDIYLEIESNLSDSTDLRH
ncbi:glycosyltransferase family 2 protein [Methanosarcina sp.]|uniref:glycosyltransferase family 2 protein n=1 Tax=Methanosarcina sp. TaxID=2213 RepID=UPI002988AE2D|nr:glycosyltransferase family 2 protein [Methanosarcina sp.]MDW5549191.1 glycosyltransferase family 2 protein [Methanosarcina sp.]MDW5553103.1 glycosyltransferase family 2 protein [Methanosarcina sp.]MDW5559371.1 glycosyltransferase family 2 protein [Methanosarcina sp.]